MERVKTKSLTLPLTLVHNNYVLGIDAGATKTAAAIGTLTTKLGQGEAAGADVHTISRPKASAHLRSATQAALTNSHLSRHLTFRTIVVGMAGIDSPADLMAAERFVKEALNSWMDRHTKLIVVNDIHLVFRSGSDAKDGIAVIAGTGSHALGMNQQGDMAYAGGLGYILADEGSAYMIGYQALHAAVQSADGRIRSTQLEQRILKHFNVTTVRGIVPKLYQDHYAKAQIAQLAHIVEQAAAANDWCAKIILQQNVTALVQHVTAVAKKVGLTKRSVDIVVSGGLWQMHHWPFLKKFTSSVKRSLPHATVINPQHPPVWGAVKLAQAQWCSSVKS